MDQKNTRPVHGRLRKLRALFLVTSLVAASANGQPLSVEVQRMNVVGNTLLTPAQLSAALPSLPARLGFSDIELAAQTLQQAYRNAGYGAVVVRIAEQNLDAGTVRLDVIEGRVSAIQVTGQQRFSRDNILRSLPSLSLGRTPDLKTLDAELLMANENPAKTARVVFQPGERAAAVEALVVVEEQETQRWEISADNTGNATTGKYRLTLGYQHANLGDRDVVLGARASVSPTSLSKVLIAGLDALGGLIRPSATCNDGAWLGALSKPSGTLVDAHWFVGA